MTAADILPDRKQYYQDLSFEEIRKIAQDEESRLDQAVKHREWKLAAKIEESL